MTEDQRRETAEAQQYALRMLGEYMVRYAESSERIQLDNMKFWHDQAWKLSQELAKD